MAKDELKGLPPEDRLKKLKELEKKKKEELAEAEKLIKESQEEITDQRKSFEKIPVPEVKKEELEGLSEEGKRLVELHRGLQKKQVTEEEKPVSPGKKKGKKEGEKENISLEEAVGQDKRAMDSALAGGLQYGFPTGGRSPAAVAAAEYRPFSDRPTTELYREMISIKEQVEGKGYISRADERKAEYITGAIQERLEAAEIGRYSFSEETARAASLTQRLGMSVQQAYKSGSRLMHDWYKGV